MIVTAWNNGMHLSSGGGYGVTIKKEDIHNFRREWGVIRLKLAGRSGYVDVNIDKDSFWNYSCPHLIKKEIGAWFREKNIIPWHTQLRLEHITANRFKLRK